jgi:hypothetical protein
LFQKGGESIFGERGSEVSKNKECSNDNNLSLSSRKFCWVHENGMDHEMAWCSFFFAGNPNTSLK